MDKTVNKKHTDFVIYETDDKISKVSVRLEEETVWLTQAHLVELFQSSKANISEHIKHIFDDGELNKNSVVRKFRTTAADGKNFLDTKLRMLNKDVLTNKGNISHRRAIEKAEKEFDICRQREMRQLESDFDRAVKQLTQKSKK